MIDRQDLAAVIVSGKLSQSSTLKGPRNTLLLYFDTLYRLVIVVRCIVTSC